MPSLHEKAEKILAEKVEKDLERLIPSRMKKMMKKRMKFFVNYLPTIPENACSPWVEEDTDLPAVSRSMTRRSCGELPEIVSPFAVVPTESEHKQTERN